MDHSAHRLRAGKLRKTGNAQTMSSLLITTRFRETLDEADRFIVNDGRGIIPLLYFSYD